MIKVNYLVGTTSYEFHTDLDQEPNLHMVRIRFGSFSFNKITKGIKANWFDKISHFGATAGLFNGFTIIALLELLAFLFICVLKCLASLIQFCKSVKNKVKQSIILEVKEFRPNEDIIANDDIKKTLNDMTQKFEALLNEKDVLMGELEKKVGCHDIEEMIDEELCKK